MAKAAEVRLSAAVEAPVLSGGYFWALSWEEAVAVVLVAFLVEAADLEAVVVEASVVLGAEALAVVAPAEAGRSCLKNKNPGRYNSMLRRDLILAEIQKLIRLLAKVAGLKLQGKVEEAEDLADMILSEELNLEKEELNTILPEDFRSYLLEKNFSAEKLDLLSKVMSESASSYKTEAEYQHRLRLILVIYDNLEKVHHIQSLSNLTNRSAIERSLDTEHL